MNAVWRSFDGIEHKQRIISGMKKNSTEKNQKCCRLCRNHSIKAPMKDHKNSCKYQSCVCGFCKVTLAKRSAEVNRRKIRLKNVKQQNTTTFESVQQQVQCPFCSKKYRYNMGVLQHIQKCHNNDFSTQFWCLSVRW